MYSTIFIGSGHAAWHGAVLLALSGKKVALVEEDLTGGTCTNYGCDAKIVLDGPFEHLQGLQNYRDINRVKAILIKHNLITTYKPFHSECRAVTGSAFAISKKVYVKNECEFHMRYH